MSATRFNLGSGTLPLQPFDHGPMRTWRVRLVDSDQASPTGWMSDCSWQENTRMRALKIAVAVLALACPSFAVAQEAALAGAVTGALTGAVIVGPLGGMIGAAAGAVVGSVAQANMHPNGTFQAPSAR